VDYVSGALPQYAILPVRFNGPTNEFIAKGAPPAPLATNQLSFSDLVNASLVATGNVSGILTVALKTLSGADATVANPITIPFQDPAGSGTPVYRQITSALSLPTVIGAHFGQSAAAGAGVGQLRLWVVAIDNNGVVVLGLTNCASIGATSGFGQIFPIDEYNPQNTSLLNASSTSAGVIYSASALTGKSIRILGYVEYVNGLATPGTYTTNPTGTKNFGVGMKKPGEGIQQLLTNTTTQAQLTPINTKINMSGWAISPSLNITSKCNAVRARASIPINVPVASQQGNMSIFRSTNAFPVGTFGIYQSAQGGAAIIPMIPLQVLDFPGTSGALTYGVYGTSAVGTTSTINQPGASSAQPIASLELEEVVA
jgi:hypothetical protein